MESLSELASIDTGLKELTQRVGAIAGSTKQEDLRMQLYEIERLLLSANRRLEKTLRETA